MNHSKILLNFEGIAYFICNLHSGVDELTIIASIQRHSVIPKVFEEMWQDFIHNVLRFDTISATTLLHYLKE